MEVPIRNEVVFSFLCLLLNILTSIWWGLSDNYYFRLLAFSSQLWIASFHMYLFYIKKNELALAYLCGNHVPGFLPCSHVPMNIVLEFSFHYSSFTLGD